MNKSINKMHKNDCSESNHFYKTCFAIEETEWKVIKLSQFENGTLLFLEHLFSRLFEIFGLVVV